MFSVIVPTYNERDNVRALLERVLPVFGTLGEDAELLILDDNSPDGTAEEVRSVAEEMGATDQVRAIVRTEDRGLAKAVMEGFRQARGDVVAVMDADLSHPPEVLADLLAPIRSGEAEIAVASRRVEGGGIENWPWTRRFTSWSAALMARPLVSVRDTTSGYFAVRKDLLDDVELRPIGYKIALEVLVRTDSHEVAEVPFVFTDRTAGKSKLGGAVMLAYLQQLVGLYKQRIFGREGAPGTPWRRRALLLVWGLAALHILMAGFVDLAPDEAYYWQWARSGHLAAGYYDHPPMVAWLIAGGTWLFGTNEFGVRVLTALLLAGLGWLVFRMTTGLVRRAEGTSGYSPECAGFLAAAALLAMPLICVNGFIASPDVPLLFFWAATLGLTLTALRTGRTATWLAAGVALGLTGLSKYHAALLPVAIFIGLLMSPAGRRALKRPGPYLAVAACALVMLPYALWLLERDFGGLGFQLDHGTERSWSEPRSALSTFGEFVAGQLAFVTPVLFLFLLYALARARGAIARPERPLLVAAALVPLLLFTYAGFKAGPEANWPSVAYVSACVLLGPLFAGWLRSTIHAKLRVWIAIGIAAIASAYIHLEIARPLFLRVGFVDKFEAREPFGLWAHDVRRSRGPEGLAAPVLGDSYRTASLLAFYMPDRPFTGAPFEFGSGEQYAYWEAEVPLTEGARAWFVTRAEYEPRVDMLFSEHEELGRFEGKRLGEVTRTYRIYWGVLRGDPIERAPLR